MGEIAVKVPKGWNSVSLSLKESRQKITKPVKNGIAVFDLSKFADSLRLGKQDLQELIIESDGLAPSVLMRIRTKWLVDKVEFEDREEAGQRIVNIRWTELGKAENRVIRLWPLDRGGTTVYEYPLPDNVYSYVITEGTDKLRPGKYLLQYEEVDLWSSGKALFPKESSRNCIELQLGEIIDLTGIKWRLVETQKWLDIPGRLWYKRLGQIEVLMPDDVRGDSAYIFGEGCRVALEHIEGQKYIADCTKFIAEVANCSAHPYKIKMAVSGLHFEFLEVFSEWKYTILNPAYSGTGISGSSLSAGMKLAMQPEESFVYGPGIFKNAKNGQFQTVKKPRSLSVNLARFLCRKVYSAVCHSRKFKQPARQTKIGRQK